MPLVIVPSEEAINQAKEAIGYRELDPKNPTDKKQIESAPRVGREAVSANLDKLMEKAGINKGMQDFLKKEINESNKEGKIIKTGKEKPIIFMPTTDGKEQQSNKSLIERLGDTGKPVSQEELNAVMNGARSQSSNR